MIVTCERCATQFQLDDSRVPARGVRVRCSRCKNAFRVVPPGQRAADEIAELSRRAREDSQEEITQDLDGDSRSRSGSRRGGASAKAAAAAAHGSAGSGLDTEESDWKFNEDVSAEREAPIRSREEPKPEPPPVRRGAEADDWFRGGGDSPLELDDRPWNADAAEAAAPEPEPQRAEREPEPEPEPATPASLHDDEPSLDRFVEPDEPVAATAAASEPTDEFDAMPSFGDPEPPAQEQKASSSTDELSSDGWDEMFGEAGEAAAGEAAEAPATERKPSRRRPSLPSFGGVGAHVARWIGHGAHAAGWIATIGLFGAGLYSGLRAQAPAPNVAAVEQVGGFELVAIQGRFVENAVGGRLYVVSSRVRNPGPSIEMLQGLEVELLDASGQPVGSQRAALRPPIQRVILRESPVSELAAQPAQVLPLGPGEERLVEGVFTALPAAAASFRIVAAHAPRGGALPEVELPR
ncbi:MAG TPA: zinc-ribbon domain-containing protein [Myxococcota bacterium]|nr:zinc-ribbon domain-containing protein [Myxococcota bacterium]